MKHLKRTLPFLLALSIAGLLSFSGPIRLIQIQKESRGLLGVLTRLQIDVIQELRTCYLARADRQDIRSLRKSGLHVAVLDIDAMGKSYLLLPPPPPLIRSNLSRIGCLLEVEAETFLFWTENGDPAAALPSGLPRKPLPTGSILPYLRPALPFQKKVTVAQPVNDLIDEIGSQVSSDNLRGLVQALQDFQTRHVSTPNCNIAGQYIYNYFQTLGLDVRFQDVEYSAGAVSKNVIAELPGQVYPEDVLIICGHYDSHSDFLSTLAPGADDNASGTAAAMEAARILTAYPLDFTVRFIAFTAEEIGLFGSRKYAAEARAQRENIIGIINLDMIAYPDNIPEDLEIIVNPASEWLATKFLGVSGAYGLVDINPVVNASIVYSDHSPFWDQGYPALLAIEDYPDPVRNPYYHSPADTIDTLDFGFFRDSTRAALTVLAEMAQPVRVDTPSLQGLRANPKPTAPCTFLSEYPLSWASRPGAAGYNIYRSAVPHQVIKIKLRSGHFDVYLDRFLQTENHIFMSSRPWELMGERAIIRSRSGSGPRSLPLSRCKPSEPPSSRIRKDEKKIRPRHHVRLFPRPHLVFTSRHPIAFVRAFSAEGENLQEYLRPEYAFGYGGSDRDRPELRPGCRHRIPLR